MASQPGPIHPLVFILVNSCWGLSCQLHLVLPISENSLLAFSGKSFPPPPLFLPVVGLDFRGAWGGEATG